MNFIIYYTMMILESIIAGEYENDEHFIALGKIDYKSNTTTQRNSDRNSDKH